MGDTYNPIPRIKLANNLAKWNDHSHKVNTKSGKRKTKGYCEHTCINKAPKAEQDVSSSIEPTQNLSRAQSTKANPYTTEPLSKSLLSYRKHLIYHHTEQ